LSKLVDSINVINLSLINLRDNYARNDAAGGTLFVTKVAELCTRQNHLASLL